MKTSPKANAQPPTLNLLIAPAWKDYELLDSGDGAKLERYGPYRFVRPEHQAIWKRRLPARDWEAADAVFLVARGEESGGRWSFRHPVKSSWEMEYQGLRFQAQASGSRHMGVFPEQAAHWDWIEAQIQQAQRPVRVLNLFGYTGLASLAAARAGAHVTHVDASKKAVAIARQNQALSGLETRPIRWIVDDAFKFVGREGRRASKYDALILDPPKFGRGPQGQVWEFFEQLPALLNNCRNLLSEEPLFIVLTAYAIRASALSIYYAIQEMTTGLAGDLEAGELAIAESNTGRILSTAIYVRWSTTREKTNK